MNKISCNTIRDILPLYVDEVVSEDTRTMVVEHLGQCAECRKQYENMKTKVVVPVEDDIKPLKRFKTAWKKKKNTSHTFSSTNSKCARCGYVRTYIIPTLLTPMAKNTQITLTARTNHTVSSISMSVKTPNGATTNLGTVTNTNSISKVYTPTVAAHPNDLYTVTVTAVSADGVTTSSTWTFRTY